MFGQVMNLRNLTQTVSAFHAVAPNDADFMASEIRQMTQQMPLYCVTEQRSRDWAVSKTGALIRREFVNLVFEKQKAV